MTTTPSDCLVSEGTKLPLRTMGSLTALEMVRLTKLMARTSGRPEIKIGLIDGPVASNHPDLRSSNIQDIPGKTGGSCLRNESTACTHGTFVAGILCAKRGGAAPAIAPNCTLLVRPIFLEVLDGNDEMPSAKPEELAQAIIETVNAGARVINLSAALIQGSLEKNRALTGAFDYAARHAVIVVAAAGNQSRISSSGITGNPWVIPVAGCDSQGRPVNESNFGVSIGIRGLSAPAENITSLGPDGGTRRFGGTSAAAPFVTGTIALLWSEFPSASAAELKFVVTGGSAARRTTIVPPVLDASMAYEAMSAVRERR